MTAERASNNCDRPPCSLLHTPSRISESMFAMDDHYEEKITQQNIFVRSGKSEVEVTNKQDEQVANLLCAQANSASYPQRDGKSVVATATE